MPEAKKYQHTKVATYSSSFVSEVDQTAEVP
jgi:hypothetical protein